MKIERVRVNNRRKAFGILTPKGEYAYPYARLTLKPSAEDRLVFVAPDAEAGEEACTLVISRFRSSDAARIRTPGPAISGSRRTISTNAPAGV